MYFILACGAVHAENTQYDITAVLITKLVSFVSWPEDRAPNPDKIRLCILEDSQKSSIRPLLLANNSLQKHFFILPRNTIDKCQAVFVGEHSNHKISHVLSEIGKLGPVLTFSATENYANKGVMINFYTDDQKVRFEINWNAMKKAELKISSRILKLARIVE